MDFQGIAKDAKGKRIVIINGEMLKKGARLDALEVVEITENKAIVTIEGKRYNLNLYEIGGKSSD